MDVAKRMRETGIEIPRIRMCDTMERVLKVDTEEYINSIREEVTNQIVDDALSSTIPFDPNPMCFSCGKEVNDRRRKYLEYDEGYELKPNHIKSIRWELFEEEDRNRIKSFIEAKLLQYRGQHEVFNKYVGDKDVLYVHARLGSGNWYAFEGSSIEQQPWFLEKFDDPFDSTYCDIYCKLKEENPDE